MTEVAPGFVGFQVIGSLTLWEPSSPSTGRHDDSGVFVAHLNCQNQFQLFAASLCCPECSKQQQQPGADRCVQRGLKREGVSL